MEVLDIKYDTFDQGGNVRKLNNISDYVSTGSSFTCEEGAQSQGRLHSSTKIALEAVKGIVNLDLCADKVL